MLRHTPVSIRWLMMAGALSMSACSHTQPKQTPKLPYGDWQLSEISQGDDRLSLADADTKFTLSLDSEGKAMGQVACNRWHGTGTVTETTLHISAAGVTRKRCQFSDAQVQTLEHRYLRALREPVAYQVGNATLTLQLTPQEKWTFTAQE